MPKGVDYSYARPGAANIKAKGYEFVCRYLSNSPGKNISPSEAQDLLNNGLGIILVWETTANRALDGRAAGIADARSALALANGVGQPDFLPIFFAVDFDATPAQQAAIDEYLKGAATVLGAAWVGVYGGYWVVKRCLDNGSAKWGWQTYAWSGGNIDPRIHIYQFKNGGDFNGGADLNEANQANYGAWFKTPVPVPVPPPAPLPTPSSSPSASVSASISASPSSSVSSSPSSSVSASVSSSVSSSASPSAPPEVIVPSFLKILRTLLAWFGIKI